MPDQLLLLIADIGGYTRFMQQHKFALAHAQELIASLLEAVLDAAKPFQLAKLEGDAAFLYSGRGVALCRAVSEIRANFLQRQQQLAQDRMCTCDACTNVSSLSLKFVAHQGEAAFQKVKRHTELAGVDVILVHRMLKNDVPLSEYLLVTDALRDQLDPSAVRVEHDFEGLGRTATHYLPLDALPAVEAPSVSPNLARRLWGKVALEVRSVPYLLGLKRPCAGFRNVEIVKGPEPR